MGSLEEDELVQMVHDFIESESTSSPTSSTCSNCHTLNHRTQYFILQDILRSEGGNTAACEAKVLKHMRGRKGGAEKTTISLSRSWLVMRMKMDGLNASICHSSWATSLGCPSGEYEYIEVIIEDEKYGKAKRLIVDIDFRSQFEVARPTEDYREMTESVPVIFVGSENKLCKIISVLCSAAKQCLREKGLHVPPWRTASYMQAKWLSVTSSSKEASHAGDDVIGAHNNITIGSNWVPPLLKPKKRDLGGGSGLSTQLSNMSVNCC